MLFYSRRYLKEIRYIGVIIIFLALSSCSKFIQTDPPSTSLTGSTVFLDDASATAALIGIYERMEKRE